MEAFSVKVSAPAGSSDDGDQRAWNISGAIFRRKTRGRFRLLVSGCMSRRSTLDFGGTSRSRAVWECDNPYRCVACVERGRRRNNNVVSCGLNEPRRGAEVREQKRRRERVCRGGVARVWWPPILPTPPRLRRGQPREPLQRRQHHQDQPLRLCRQRLQADIRSRRGLDDHRRGHGRLDARPKMTRRSPELIAAIKARMHQLLAADHPQSMRHVYLPNGRPAYGCVGAAQD